jgi:hypothetical protein
VWHMPHFPTGLSLFVMGGIQALALLTASLFPTIGDTHSLLASVSPWAVSPWACVLASELARGVYWSLSIGVSLPVNWMADRGMLWYGPPCLGMMVL